VVSLWPFRFRPRKIAVPPREQAASCSAKFRRRIRDAANVASAGVHISVAGEASIGAKAARAASVIPQRIDQHEQRVTLDPGSAF
jgi:hypothetical protein